MSTPAELLCRLGDGVSDLRLVAHVADDRQSLAAGLLDLLGRREHRARQLRMRFRGLRDQSDVRAVLGDPLGDREADPPAPARHDNCAAFEVTWRNPIEAREGVASLDWRHGAAPRTPRSGDRLHGPVRAPAARHAAALAATYGDVFTVRFLVFGTGVYVADPAAIREMFTGDQSDLHAGEANAPLSPVLGENSVLVLDGPEHLRQRKLLLPPFQGSAVQRFREVIREVAEAEVATLARRATSSSMRERMRALTFEVICRAVFGVTERGAGRAPARGAASP